MTTDGPDTPPDVWGERVRAVGMAAAAVLAGMWFVVIAQAVARWLP